MKDFENYYGRTSWQDYPARGLTVGRTEPETDSRATTYLSKRFISVYGLEVSPSQVYRINTAAAC